MENGGPVFPIYHVFRAIAGAKSDAALNASVTKHFRTTGELR